MSSDVSIFIYFYVLINIIIILIIIPEIAKMQCYADNFIIILVVALANRNVASGKKVISIKQDISEKCTTFGLLCRG